jgi:hypothetical protein
MTTQSISDPDHSLLLANIVWQLMTQSPDPHPAGNIGQLIFDQETYAKTIGSADPLIYAAAAAGLALAGDGYFVSTLGPTAIPNDADFILAAYQVFGQPPTPAQAAVFQGELTYLEHLYTAAGLGDAAHVDLLARGAVYGEMIGIASAIHLGWSI